MEERKASVQIARLDARGKLLTIEDMIMHKIDQNARLDEGKLIVTCVEYNTDTHKMINMFKHFVDTSTMRKLIDDIVNERFISGIDRYLPVLDEFKGGSGTSCGHSEWEYASRQLSITPSSYKEKMYIDFKFTIQEGMPSATGAIMPKRDSTPSTIKVGFQLSNVKEALLSVKDYILAKEILLMKDAVVPTIPSKSTDKPQNSGRSYSGKSFKQNKEPKRVEEDIEDPFA